MHCIRAILLERAAILQEIDALDESDPQTEDLGESVMSLDRVFGELQDAYDEARIAEPGYPDVDNIIERAKRLSERNV